MSKLSARNVWIFTNRKDIRLKSNLLFYISNEPAIAENPNFGYYFIKNSGIIEKRKLGSIQGLKARVQYIEQHEDFLKNHETFEHYTRFLTKPAEELTATREARFTNDFLKFRSAFLNLSRDEWINLSTLEQIQYKLNLDTTRIVYETKESLSVHNTHQFQKLLKPDTNYYISSSVWRYW